MFVILNGCGAEGAFAEGWSAVGVDEGVGGVGTRVSKAPVSPAFRMNDCPVTVSVSVNEGTGLTPC
jgi:hypothetical protein